MLALDARVKLTSVLISLLLLVFNRYLVSCTVGFVEVGGVLLVSFHVEVYVEEVILKVLPLVWTVQFVPCSVTNKINRILYQGLILCLFASLPENNI